LNFEPRLDNLLLFSRIAVSSPPRAENGPFAPPAIEALDRRSSLCAPSGRGPCTLDGLGQLRSWGHLASVPIDPGVALHHGTALWSHGPPFRPCTGTPSARGSAVCRPVLQAEPALDAGSGALVFIAERSLVLHDPAHMLGRPEFDRGAARTLPGASLAHVLSARSTSAESTSEPRWLDRSLIGGRSVVDFGPQTLHALSQCAEAPTLLSMGSIGAARTGAVTVCAGSNGCRGAGRSAPRSRS
jgi:hypothetical protein